MSLFIIGDVHGCFYTVKALIEKYWDSQNDTLIQVGDLIDRGLHSAKVVNYFQELQKQYGEKVVVLLGNHESLCIEHFEGAYNQSWVLQGGQQTIESFEKDKIDRNAVISWFKKLPLRYENDFVFCSHAGISESSPDPYNLKSAESIIWTRSALKDLGKLQVVGHTPMRNGEPYYSEANHTIYIDTGVFLRLFLTAIKISDQGEILQVYRMPTKKEDL